MTEDDYQIMVTVTEKSKVGGKYVSTSASVSSTSKLLLPERTQNIKEQVTFETDTSSLSILQCPISYKNTPPLADIRGGFQRTSRVGKPLQFLGIYSRDNDAALQIGTNLITYYKRSESLQFFFHMLFFIKNIQKKSLFWFSTCKIVLFRDFSQISSLEILLVLHCNIRLHPEESKREYVPREDYHREGKPPDHFREIAS